MDLQQRKPLVIFGVIFGAWLGLIYAFITQAINWLYMPDIPLAPPTGSVQDYFLTYFLMGALLGLVTSLPSNRFLGMALGGFASAALIVGLVVTREWGFDTFGASLMLLIIGFMPLAVLLMSLSLVIRLGVDAQQVDPDRPYLWARRVFIPLALTLLAVLVGTISLHSPQERAGFRYVNEMIQQGMSASSVEALPEPLLDVSGFMENARGAYTLSWSDRIDTFFGPRPAGSEMSQFLIITRYENGFALACVFSQNRTVPTCANHR